VIGAAADQVFLILLVATGCPLEKVSIVEGR